MAGKSWLSAFFSGHRYSSHRGCIDTSLLVSDSSFSFPTIQCRACFWYFRRSMTKVFAGSKVGVLKSKDCAFLYSESSWSCSSSAPSSASSPGEDVPSIGVPLPVFGFSSFFSALSAACNRPCRLCLSVFSFWREGCRLIDSKSFTRPTWRILKSRSSEVSFSSKMLTSRLSSGLVNFLLSKALRKKKACSCKYIVSLVRILSGTYTQLPSNEHTFWSINAETQAAESFSNLPTSCPLSLVNRTTTSCFLRATTRFLDLGCILKRSIETFSLCLSSPDPLVVAQPTTPKEPMYRFDGMSLSMGAIGVEAPEPCEAVVSSDSVRISEHAMVVWAACGRGWNIGAGGGAAAEAHEPSRYKLIAA